VTKAKLAGHPCGIAYESIPRIEVPPRPEVGTDHGVFVANLVSSSSSANNYHVDLSILRRASLSGFVQVCAALLALGPTFTAALGADLYRRPL
jgi:hypothetical protein